MKKLSRLLIANRGEIAVRIAKAAAELEIETVTVYAQDDSGALHSRVGTNAFALTGTGPSAYLDMQQIVDCALAQKCDAIHPGYGFLSESAEFAQLCEDNSLIFVGPDAACLKLFADKAAARALATQCNVPVPAGTDSATSLAEAQRFVEGMPQDSRFFVKAIAGGGGRGMRVVEERGQLANAFAECEAEAIASFGKGDLYIEEMIPDARHVEVQILGDGKGALIHVWDRECSLQRRNQKLIEIAPCPPLPPGTRENLIEAALKMAESVDYRSLGTFEFLVSEDGRFWFMEANPRLQVEHTVTEEVTGIDLVCAQLRIAAGMTLAEIQLGQEDVPEPVGYAIQARLNMEQMNANGVPEPSSGVITRLELPSGPGTRVDTFGYLGYQTSALYDSLLAKVISHSRSADFAKAVRKIERTLSFVDIAGVSTNVDLLRSVLKHPAVQEGRFNTRFIETNLAELISAIDRSNLYPEIDGSIAVESPKKSNDRPLPDGTVGIATPMHGTLVELTVTVADHVSAGQQIGIVEAMKMQMPVVCDVSGTVSEIFAASGDLLQVDDHILALMPAEGEAANTGSVETQDLDHIRPELAELQERKQTLEDQARPEAVARRKKLGKRTVRENLSSFFDETRFSEFGSLTFAAQKSRKTIEELIKTSPADGLVAAIGSVNSFLFGEDKSRCMALAYDYTVMAGTQGINSHRKKDRMLELAASWQIPLMVFAEGGGGRPGDTDYQGVSGLDSMTFRRLAELNGKVPIVGVVTGRCFAGNAAMLGCSDVIIATRDSNIGMAGPAMIEGGGLGVVKPEEVGPVSVQSRNGVIDILVNDEQAAIDTARQYLAFFQGNLNEWQEEDPRILRHSIPENRMHVYDVRQVVNHVADVGTVMELRAGFAPPLLTFLARIKGRAVGLIANNTQALGGAIDADSADKATRFMQLCDAFGLPVISLCDTPGFMVGPDAEETALVRHVSRMFVTGASLSVPMVTLVLRKAYGLGAMAMAAGSFHATDATLSWPTGEFGGMGLEGAVRLAYRAELAAASPGDERETLFREKVDELYEHGKALNVASTLEIDDVIDPAETRDRIVEVLASAGEKKCNPARTRIDTW